MTHAHSGGGLPALAALPPGELDQLRGMTATQRRALVSGFSIDNPTVAGGTGLLDIANEQRRIRNERQLGQAAVGQDLFSQFFAAQTEANRRPISIVDQLMLQGQIGSQFPLSQASDERLARFTRPGQNSTMERLRELLERFASGLNTTDPPLQLAHGGQLLVDPNKRKSGGVGSVAGPVTINDRTGKTVAVAGEAGGAETINVQPLPESIQKVVGRFGDPGFTVGSIGGAVQEHTAQKGATEPVLGIEPTEDNVAFVPPSVQELPDTLTRSERFRAEELMRLRPDLDVERIVAIARHPEGLQALIGGPPDPRKEAAQRLSDSIGNDNRFTDSFVRALAIGQSPRGGIEATARDVTTLSPFNLEILKGIIGEDLFSQFGFELNAVSPTGTRARQSVVGGVRV